MFSLLKGSYPLRSKKKFESFMIITLSIVFALVFFASNLRIKLGPIDDHEIVRFLGSDQRLWFWEIPNVLVDMTEVGEFTQNARFRPTYYLIRLLESSAFGANSSLWYLARIAMVAAICTFFALGFMKLFTFKNSIFKGLFLIWFLVSALSISAWRDIISRLGPSEIYLVLGIAAFFYLSILLVIDSVTYRRWILISITFVAIVGAKENGILFLIPYLVLGLFVIVKASQRNLRFTLIFYLSTFLAATIVTGWLLGTINNQGDIYGDARDPSAAMTLLLHYITDYVTGKPFVFSALVILFHLLVNKTNHLDPTRSFYFILISNVIFVAIRAGEIVFYQGSFANPRYAVVTQLLTLMSYALIGILFANTIWNLNFANTVLKNLITVGAVLGIGSILVNHSIKNTLNAYQAFNAVSNDYSLRNENFQNELEKITFELESGDFDALVIQISAVWDYEPAYAFLQYLEFGGQNLPTYLKVIDFPVSAGLEEDLLMALKKFSADGSQVWLVEPLSQLGQSETVYCVTINGAARDVSLCDN